MNSNPRPLSALLSQILGAYTIEIDNEFELRMARAGFLGERVSLVLWANVIRFIPADGISVGELAKRSLSSAPQLKLFLGCLERWRYIKFHPGNVSAGSIREGWGSGRGIALNWIAYMTRKGKLAASLWPKIWNEIEDKWKSRFGSDFTELCQSLQNIADQIEIELPLGFPGGGFNVASGESYPARRSKNETGLTLAALLSQVLLEFTLEFDHKSKTPLSLSANVIRVLDRERDIHLNELPALTGGSSETSDIGWQLKRYVEVKKDPSAKRGKVIRLTTVGGKAHDEYYKLTAEIEKSWEEKFGAEKVRALRFSLEALLDKRDDSGLVIRLGLIPPQGTARSGALVPALGRKDVGPAARQRTRDLVAQTQLFIKDPKSLPHFPMWDANRGFGP